MENLSSAAAQGEQAFDPHHANGYNFTGAGPNVQTLEDAARQAGFQSDIGLVGGTVNRVLAVHLLH